MSGLTHLPYGAVVDAAPDVEAQWAAVAAPPGGEAGHDAAQGVAWIATGGAARLIGTRGHTTVLVEDATRVMRRVLAGARRSRRTGASAIEVAATGRPRAVAGRPRQP